MSAEMEMDGAARGLRDAAAKAFLGAQILEQKGPGHQRLAWTQLMSARRHLDAVEAVLDHWASEADSLECKQTGGTPVTQVRP